MGIKAFSLLSIVDFRFIPHSTVAPPNLRGVLGTMTQFFMVIGILLADVVGFALANETRWRWMFALTSIIALIQLLLTPLLLESPRWLLMKSPNSNKARFVIKKLRGFRYDEEVETEVEHYVSCCFLLSFFLCSFVSLRNKSCLRFPLFSWVLQSCSLQIMMVGKTAPIPRIGIRRQKCLLIRMLDCW